MNQEHHQTYDELLQQAVAKELATRDDLLPPWLKHPEIPRYSIGWRMGYGESYMWTWDKWAEHFNQDQLLEYFRKYTPIPVEWLDWVANRLGYNDLDDILSGNGEFTGIRWLEQQGLADFAKFKAWYDEHWGRQIKGRKSVNGAA